jgi:hypothetical protein
VDGGRWDGDKVQAKAGRFIVASSGTNMIDGEQLHGLSATEICVLLEWKKPMQEILHKEEGFVEQAATAICFFGGRRRSLQGYCWCMPGRYC